MKQWHAWLELARISNLPTVWTNVLAGWLLAGGAWNWPILAWLLAGGSLLYTAGMILNDAFDAKFDRQHRKERPIPSGRVTARAAWIAGVLMLLSGAALCTYLAGACGWLVLALVAAIVAYDAFHKPWAGSVLIMGSCRALLYLVAGSAVTGGLSWEANEELVVKAVALGGYIVGVSLVARSESGAAASGKVTPIIGGLLLCLPFTAVVAAETSWGVEMLFGIAAVSFGAWAMVTPPWKSTPERPSGGCLQHGHLLIPAIVLLDVIGLISGSAQAQEELVRGFIRVTPLLICAIILVWLIKRALEILRTPPASNIGKAVGLLLAGIVVVDALAVSLISGPASLIFAASMPLLLLWQRKIAAT